MPFIVVDHVSHTLNPHAGESVSTLRDVSFGIREGEYVAIIGANGSGKTTLIRHLNGLLLPASGEVTVDGLSTKDPEALAGIRKIVSMVFQSPEDQMIGLTVESEAAFGPECLGFPPDLVRERVESVLRALGLWNERRKSPLALSAGRQQRLAIAGAMAVSPRCLVLDEAGSMLDPVGRADLLSILHDLHSHGMTVISVTNRMEEAAYADRLLVLSDGRLVLDGSPESVFPDPSFPGDVLGFPPAFRVASGLRSHLPSFPQSVLTPAALADAVEAAFHGRKSAAFLRTEGSRASRGASSGEPVIRVKDLTFSYEETAGPGRNALESVNFELHRGECVVLLGTTGSGKTTFLQHLVALLPVREGTVEVLGSDLGARKTDVRKVRFSAGLCFQRPEDQLFEHYTGEDVAFGPVKQGVTGTALRERVRPAMETAGLEYEKYKLRPTAALSGGEKRRAGIAGVLALEPSIYLFDEPYAGLDAAGRETLTEMLLELKRRGRSIVLVSHSPEDVAAVADRAVVFREGRIVLQGVARDVLADRDGLLEAGLEPPFAAGLAFELSERGIGSPGPLPVTGEEAVGFVLRALEGAEP